MNIHNYYQLNFGYKISQNLWKGPTISIKYSILNLKEYKNHWKTLCLWGFFFLLML